MSKKKVIAARNLKDWTKITTQNYEKQKRKSIFLIATILCFPDLRIPLQALLKLY
jgi:hypothetical protein